MVLMTGKEYIESLRKLKVTAYFLGEEITNTVDHPFLRPSLNSVAMTYDLAHNPDHKHLATAKSHLTGEVVNRFTHINRSIDDLIKKTKLLRVIGKLTGACFQRCVGWDAINAVESVTYEIDKQHGSNYHARFNKYLQRVQERDLTLNGAMTDVKGDRARSPSQQDDPDLYVHVVEKRKDGIIVKGAKTHQTGALNSHEVLVLPTTRMREGDADYAVAFAAPINDPNIHHVVGRQYNDLRKIHSEIDQGNIEYSSAAHECLVVFDDTFIPQERVFLCGEYEFTGSLVERFAAYHRQNYGGCKTGYADVLIGATMVAAEQTGIAKASHVKDKIGEMIHLTETMYACGIACAMEGKPLPSGTYLPDVTLANVCKANVTRFPFENARLATDIAGGNIGTMPSEHDLNHPEAGKYVKKYFKTRKDVSAEDRLKIIRLLENMTMGSPLAESMHGAGSPQTQRVMIRRYVDLAEKMKLAKKLAGIKSQEKS